MLSEKGFQCFLNNGQNHIFALHLRKGGESILSTIEKKTGLNKKKKRLRKSFMPPVFGLKTPLRSQTRFYPESRHNLLKYSMYLSMPCSRVYL